MKVYEESVLNQFAFNYLGVIFIISLITAFMDDSMTSATSALIDFIGLTMLTMESEGTE